MAKPFTDRAEFPAAGSRRRNIYGITLTCGDVVTASVQPLNNGSRYMCTAGRTPHCGYSLHWLSYTSYDSEGNPRVVQPNPKFEGEQ